MKCSEVVVNNVLDVSHHHPYPLQLKIYGKEREIFFFFPFHWKYLKKIGGEKNK